MDQTGFFTTCIRLTRSVALLAIVLAIGCPDNAVFVPPDVPPCTIIVHNERSFILYVDSGEWTLDVPALGSASIAVQEGTWAVLCGWDDGEGITAVWSVREYDPVIELIAHDTIPPTFTRVP